VTCFAVYDPSSGAIRRYGSCMPSDVKRQAGEGEAVIETPALAPDHKFKVDITKSPPSLAAAS
jgi:hypothetical protein